MHRLLYRISFLLFISLNQGYAEITYDSCQYLIKNGRFDELISQVEQGSFNYYLFSAKQARKTGEFAEGMQLINKALEYYEIGESDLKHADALDEYGVLLRLSNRNGRAAMKAHESSLKIRQELADSTGIGMTYLYMGNVYASEIIVNPLADSTIYYNKLAITYLDGRNEYLANVLRHNMGRMQYKLEEFSAARESFETAKKYFEDKGYDNLVVSCLLGISQIFIRDGPIDSSLLILNELKYDSVCINDLSYRRQLLNSFKTYYTKTNAFQKALVTYDSISNVEDRISAKIELEAAEKYESQRYKTQLAEEDLISTRRKWIAITLGLLLLTLTIGFLLTSRNRRQQYLIKEKDLLLQKQQALEDERNRIAAEMHDDLGGGLTTIKFVSQRARRKMDNPRDQALLDKIIAQSNTIVTNMSDIIWAMNSKFDNLSSTVAYIRRYSMEYLSDFEINLAFDSDRVYDEISLTSTVRRNLLLIVKEALNNIVKHAQATDVSIKSSYDTPYLILQISDNGIGLQSENILGNGLENMQDRIALMGGEIEYRDAEPGLTLICKIPIIRTVN